MAIMQSSDNWIWFCAEAALIVLSIFAVWFIVRTGRDRPPAKQERGEQALEDYGDGIQEDHAPLSKFLIGTYIVVAVWAGLYLIWTGINGLA